MQLRDFPIGAGIKCATPGDIFGHGVTNVTGVNEVTLTKMMLGFAAEQILMIEVKRTSTMMGRKILRGNSSFSLSAANVLTIEAGSDFNLATTDEVLVWYYDGVGAACNWSKHMFGYAPGGAEVSDGDFVLSQAAAAESKVILDLREGYDGFLDVYFETLTSSGGAGLAAMTFSVRPAYYKETGAGDVLTDADPTGALNIDLVVGVDMSIVGTVSGSWSITEAVLAGGNTQKFLHGAGLVIAGVHVGGGGGDAGTIKALVGRR